MADGNTNSGQVHVDNWQRGKSVIECNLHMLETGKASDITFRVGEDKESIHAHKYVLISRSSVFSAMFCGPLAEKGGVTIPDIDPDIFREFLKYLYSDTADVNSDNAMGLLYTSKKYGIDVLYNTCKQFLEKTLSQDNVCDILEQCRGCGETDLEEKALQILTKARKRVVQSTGFLSLSPDYFKKFLESEDLRLKEEQVFTSTLEWAKEQCRRQNKKPSPDSLRNMLGDILYEIRFPAMPVDYLVKVVGPTGILTDKERVGVMDTLVDSAADLKMFKIGRQSAKVKNVTQRMSQINATLSFEHDGEVDAIMFSTSEDIELLGCQLYGPRYVKESTNTVTIEVLDDQKVISTPMSGASITLTSNRLPPTNDVMFPVPVEIRGNNIYTLSVSIQGASVHMELEENNQ